MAGIVILTYPPQTCPGASLGPLASIGIVQGIKQAFPRLVCHQIADQPRVGVEDQVATNAVIYQVGGVVSYSACAKINREFARFSGKVAAC